MVVGRVAVVHGERPLHVRVVCWETLALFVNFHVHVVDGTSVVLSPSAMIASGDKCLNVLIIASSGAGMSCGISSTVRREMLNNNSRLSVEARRKADEELQVSRAAVVLRGKMGSG